MWGSTQCLPSCRAAGSHEARGAPGGGGLSEEGLGGWVELSCCVGEGAEEREQQWRGQHCPGQTLARLTPEILSSSVPVPLVQDANKMCLDYPVTKVLRPAPLPAKLRTRFKGVCWGKCHFLWFLAKPVSF